MVRVKDTAKHKSKKDQFELIKSNLLNPVNDNQKNESSDIDDID